MAIDVKSIQVCIWRILRMFMIFCFKFVQNHPYVSGISSFFFFLYTYYPSIFKILIYSSPVLVCTIVFLRNLLNSGRPKILNLKEDEEKNQGISCNKLGSVEGEVVVERNENSHGQTGVRRNVKENNKGLDDLSAQTVSIDDKLKEIQEEKESSSLDCVESSSREAEKVQTLDERRQVLDSEPSSSYLISRNGSDDGFHKGFGSAADLDALKMEEAEDEDEEEAQEDRNKAVEWTEDDQKNLMDLGTSEIERNKRLESLIAKRRAKKVLSMQVQRNLIDLDSGPPPGQIAPILIARNNHFDLSCKSNDPEVLPMPGSAPCVLLPMKNPFDLPYDPLEEKPNLTGDTFQQEFLPVQKDLCFCRHESFSLGLSMPGETKQDWHGPNLNPFLVSERRTSEGPVFSRFRRQSDENLVEQVLPLKSESLPPSGSACEYDHVDQEGPLFEQGVNSGEHNHVRDDKAEDRMVRVKEEGEEYDHEMESRLADGSKVHMRPGIVIDNNGSLNPSLSSEANENLSAKKSEVSENLESRMSDFPWALNNSLQKSFTCTIPKNIALESENIGQTNEPFYDSSPSASGKAGMEEQLFYDERIAGHTPSFSIASDMQVEVSEGGSPPLTIGTVSPADEESVTYEGDVDKEITSVSEEVWVASSHLSGIEENESSSRAVHEICEEDIIGVGLSGINQEYKHYIAPVMLQGITVEQATMSTSSFSSSRTELQEGEAQKIRDEVHQDFGEIEEPMSSSSSDELLHETVTMQIPQEVQNFTEKLVDFLSGDDALKNAGEPSNHPEKSSGNVNFIKNVSDLVLNVDRDPECSQSIEDKADEVPSTMHKADNAISEPADEAGSKSIEYIEKNYEEPKEHEPILESHKPSKENDNTESNKEFEVQVDELTRRESMADASNLTEDRENLTSTQDSEGIQSEVEIGISGGDLNSDDSAMTSTQPEIVVEQIVSDSSSSSSPKSVLPENVFKDQDPLPSFDHIIQVDVQHSAVENSSLFETSPENLGVTMPQIEQQVENSMDLSSNLHHDFENMQEPSSPPDRSPEEANIINHANQLLVQDKERNDNLRLVEDIEGELPNTTGNIPITEVPKPAEEVSASSAEAIEEKSEKVAECDATLSPSTSTENSNINIFVTIGSEKEPHEESTGKLEEECNGGNYKSAGDEQGESQRLIREEAILELLDFTGVNKKSPTEDIAGKSKNNTESDSMLGPSNAVGETHNQNTIKDNEDSELLIDDLSMEVTQDVKVNPTT